jgi:hypothetical protein
MMYWGRAFELKDGTIVLPCEFCGCPVFEVESHMCPGLYERMVYEAERRAIYE